MKDTIKGFYVFTKESDSGEYRHAYLVIDDRFTPGDTGSGKALILTMQSSRYKDGNIRGPDITCHPAPGPSTPGYTGYYACEWQDLLLHNTARAAKLARQIITQIDKLGLSFSACSLEAVMIALRSLGYVAMSKNQDSRYFPS